MADFPALTPNARQLTLGNFPQATYGGPSGINVRFLFNETKGAQHLLTLSYVGLTETQANLITDHYVGQQGSLIAFNLPSVVWSGYSAVPVNASNYQWQYAGAFSVEQGGVTGRFNIEVALLSVLA